MVESLRIARRFASGCLAIALLFAGTSCGGVSEETQLETVLVERDGLDRAAAACIAEEMSQSFSGTALAAARREGIKGLPRDSWQSYVWIFSACVIGADDEADS